jgi:hypothetical protein
VVITFLLDRHIEAVALVARGCRRDTCLACVQLNVEYVRTYTSTYVRLVRPDIVSFGAVSLYVYFSSFSFLFLGGGAALSRMRRACQA